MPVLIKVNIRRYIHIVMLLSNMHLTYDCLFWFFYVLMSLIKNIYCKIRAYYTECFQQHHKHKYYTKCFQQHHGNKWCIWKHYTVACVLQINRWRYVQKLYTLYFHIFCKTIITDFVIIVPYMCVYIYVQIQPSC